MKSKRIVRFGFAALLLTFATFDVQAQWTPPGASTAPQPGSALSIPQAELIQPEALNHLLQKAGPQKPLVLQVGSHVLFAQAHIAGSEYVGPGSQPGGLQALQDRVNSLARSQFIVIYCGCCPWNHCPNIEPAFSKLREMGFTNVRVLYLADNFGANWVNRGYPVEQGR